MRTSIPVDNTGSINKLAVDTNGFFSFAIPSPDTYTITFIVPDSTVGIFLPGPRLGFGTAQHGTPRLAACDLHAFGAGTWSGRRSLYNGISGRNAVLRVWNLFGNH